MTDRIAILAGTGLLPQLLAKSKPDALFVSFAGVDVELPQNPHIAASFETLGALFEGLHAAGITQVCFAGAMSRPQLDPQKFDTKMISLAPRLMAAMGQGDDGLLREVMLVFAEEGFQVIGAHQILPDLVLEAGTAVGAQSAQDQIDTTRAQSILAALGAQDVGQGAVVAGGQCLGIETLQGTNAMLSFVAATPAHLRRAKGVFVKQPKPDQDLRIDMPAIGMETVAHVINAGLAGVVISADAVLVLERDKVFAALKDAGVFLHVV